VWSVCEYQPQARAVANKMACSQILELYALMANKAKREEDELKKAQRR